MANKQGILLLVVASILAIAAARTWAETTVVDFEDLPFPPGQDFYNGSDVSGGFESKGVWFENDFEFFTATCCWQSFSYSKATDTTTNSVFNQYSAFAGSGAGGSTDYAVAFSGIDAGDSDLAPRLELPSYSQPISMHVTNTTWAALVMQEGDPNNFARKFGGPDGRFPDYFLLRVLGVDKIGNTVGETEFYLADYRDNDDYIVDTWNEVDLTPLRSSQLAAIQFRLESTDVNPDFGINTPAYVALDDLTYEMIRPGDFNGDGLVDAADYSQWRDRLGQAVVVKGTGADGDFSGIIDAGDYSVWKAAFGTNYLPSAIVSAVIPEPRTDALLGVIVVAALLTRCFFPAPWTKRWRSYEAT
ncbi:MAG: DUF4465 domain-containing protein [Aeoliella sp.]